MGDDAKDRRRSSIFGKLASALKGSKSDTNGSASGDQAPSKSRDAATKAQGASAAAEKEPVTATKTYSVEGKTALVTGAGSGINLCFAKLLLSKGCNVLVADLSLRPEAQDLIDAHSKEGSSPRASFVKTDVTHWSDLRQMFEVAYSTFGTLDIVCPGAGVFEPHWSNFWHPPGSPESKDGIDSGRYATMDINVTHPIRTTQLAIAHFLSPPTGEKVSPTNPKHIVHISSIAGQVYVLSTPLYVASKWAISGFVRSLGSLHARLGIKTTAVAPGVVKTPLFVEDPDKLKMINQDTVIWVHPEEVAEAMLKCVEDDTVPSGTILEVGSQYTRQVQAFNDPGPMGRPGIATGNVDAKIEEVFGWLAEDGWGKSGL